MRIFIKIKAGTLQYVLLISVVILILLSTFMSFVFYQTQFENKNSFYRLAFQNTLQGITLMTNQVANYNSAKNIYVTSYDFEKTTIEKKPWGIFDIGIVKSQLKNELHTRLAILGKKDYEKKSLYLVNNNKPLVLVGNSKLTGDVYLSPQGVKQGSIAGVSFYGNQLVEGTIKLSAKQLPKIENLNRLNSLLDSHFSFQLNELQEIPSKITNSFLNTSQHIRIHGAVRLINTEISGNIVITSDTQIEVDASAKLSDVILIAPKIIIHSGVNGNFQVIASKQITIEEQCKLVYPSALVLLEKSTSEIKNNSHNISISKNSEVQGVVLYETLVSNKNYDLHLDIEEKARVVGEVYCNGNFQLKGTVNGTVYTRNFITRISGGVYINHLYNAVIDAHRFPFNFAGIFTENRNYEIAKWVY